MTGPRKHDGRASHRLQLVHLHWRTRPPANENNGHGQRTDPAGAHDRAFCNRARCQTCADIMTNTRRREAQQLWLRGTQLCATAAICRAAGRALMAHHAIEQTDAIMRRRGEIHDATFGDN